MKEVLRAGEIILPAPVSITINDELIWTSDTGRTMDGTMVGEVVAEKKNISIQWGVLSEAEIILIKKGITKGFFPITFRDDGIDMTITAYRGTLSKEQIGRLSDGIFWYRKATVDLIER